MPGLGTFYFFPRLGGLPLGFRVLCSPSLSPVRPAQRLSPNGQPRLTQLWITSGPASGCRWWTMLKQLSGRSTGPSD